MNAFIDANAHTQIRSLSEQQMAVTLHCGRQGAILKC